MEEQTYLKFHFQEKDCFVESNFVHKKVEQKMLLAMKHWTQHGHVDTDNNLRKCHNSI
jgi:hypothetical protein